MFGFKYRTDVIVEIHAILKLVPQVGSLLKTFPTLKDAINEFRKAKTPEIEAAAWLSLLVIEKVMISVPPEARLLTIKYLDQMGDDAFRWFARYYQAIMANQELERPRDMPNLTAVLGFAFWYLGNAVRQNNLSEKSYQIFISDVVGMLRGWSEDERRRERLRITLNPPAEKPDAYKKGQQAAESMFASLNSLMDSRFKSISDNYLFVLRTALEKCIERTDAPPGQTCFRLSV